MIEWASVVARLVVVSLENVEIARATVTATERGDWEGALEHYDPAVELDASRVPGGGIYVGPGGVREFFTDWFGAWTHLRVQAERFIDAGDSVVVMLRIAGRGRDTGVDVSMQSGDVMTVRNDKIVRHVAYPLVAEALRSVGLQDEASAGGADAGDRG